MKLQLDISSQEAEDFTRILQKQIEKTEWVIENKAPQNEDFLQKRIDLMQRIIGQINPSLAAPENDALEIEEE